jgi:hypothetical protein
MNKRLLLLLFLVLFSVFCFSQEIEYASILIPKELKEDANAVIRNHLVEVTIEASNRMVVYERKVVTVLNKSGNVDASIAEDYDNDTKITKLSAKIYNAFGKEIKKFKKSKFNDVSAVSGGTLYSDSRVKYIDYTPISYPYTLVFESEYKTSSTGFIPRWFPTNGYYLGIESSEFILNNPLNITVITKKKNFENYPIEDKSVGSNLHFIIKSQKAIKREAYSLPSREFMPYLTVGIDYFTIKNIKGKASSWEELGKWEYNTLYKDEDNISIETITKIKSLVEGIDDPTEKAKIIYQFVQDKTRYINVSIGIGGLRPIKSEIVDKLGYGDCKGLTNYTRALLNVVGVESYFTEIYAGKTKLNMDFDFPVIHGNHVILNIPNNGNDIWLECTNQIMPFGFLGDFTDDRDVLVITPEGAIKKRTPAYLNETNIQTITSEIHLLESGDLKANLIRVSKGIQYDNKFNYETYTEKELINNYKSNVWGYNNNLEIKKVTIENNKNDIVFTENLDVFIKEFATKTTSELLFRVNVFNKESYIPKRYRNRQLPLKISRGYKDVDEVIIKIPESYVITLLPENKELKSKFGNYKVTFIKIDDTTFSYKKTILIKEGLYPKEDYKLYRKFRKSIARFENTRIALTKK